MPMEKWFSKSDCEYMSHKYNLNFDILQYAQYETNQAVFERLQKIGDVILHEGHRNNLRNVNDYLIVIKNVISYKRLME